jgi:membrane associated rhomboid family serine protease
MPLVTVLLVLANLLAYRLELASGGQAFCEAYGLIPAHFARSGEIAPIFTAMFLHANLTHLVGNLVFLAVFGAVVEKPLGHVRFAALYFASGVAGALLHVAVDPSATDAMVGCSGCLFGVLAVAGVIFPRLIGFVLAFAGLNVWYAFFGGAGNVSFGAHIGGLAAGALFAGLLRVTGFSEEEGYA